MDPLLAGLIGFVLGVGATSIIAAVITDRTFRR
jgi:hypothetical protein